MIHTHCPHRASFPLQSLKPSATLLYVLVAWTTNAIFLFFFSIWHVSSQLYVKKHGLFFSQKNTSTNYSAFQWKLHWRMIQSGYVLRPKLVFFQLQSVLSQTYNFQSTNKDHSIHHVKYFHSNIYLTIMHPKNNSEILSCTSQNKQVASQLY